MVIKIQPPSPTEMIGAITTYNERKAGGREGIDDTPVEDIDENGHILVTRNVPEGSSLEEEFERLHVLNSKKTRGRSLEKAAFHMSVNPGPDDAPLTESDIVALVDEIMTGMGYGECPYRIYKHTDIERIHYHVVSCRIGQDGKKINDSYENRRVNRLAKALAEKYGYTVGLEEATKETPRQIKAESPSEQTAEETAGNTPNRVIRPFRPDSEEPLGSQFRAFHETAMQWSFTTPEQYKALLKWRFNCEVGETDEGFTYAGLDKEGRPCTRVMTERELAINASDEIVSKCVSTDMKKKRAQKKRIESFAELAAKDCKSFSQFRKRMNEKGIYVVISYTQDGEAFGLTWMDRATRCAFKGSETNTDLNWLKERAAEAGWVIAPYHKYERVAQNRTTTRTRCRTEDEIQRAHRVREESSGKKILDGHDQTSSKRAINKDELDNDPNNIKI